MAGHELFVKGQGRPLPPVPGLEGTGTTPGTSSVPTTIHRFPTSRARGG
jgi:hypothetical protein